MNPKKFWVTQSIAFLVLISGIINILSAFYSRSLLRFHLLTQVFSIDFLNFSRSLTILTGFLLLVLSFGVLNRKISAWYLTVATLVTSLIFHLFKGLDIEESLFILISLTLLIRFRNEFTVPTGKIAVLTRIKTVIFALIFLGLYSFFGFMFLNGQFNRPATIQNIYFDYRYAILGIGQDTLLPQTHRAVWFENSISFMSVGMMLFAFSALFAPANWLTSTAPVDIKDVKKIIDKYGKNTVSYFSLMPDKNIYLSASGKSLVAYKTDLATAVVLGDPIGPSKDIRLLMTDFKTSLEKNGYDLVFYEATKKYINLYQDLGYKTLRIGYDAVINLDHFSLEGSDMRNLRKGISHSEKYNVKFTWYSMDMIPWKIMSSLTVLHQNWESKHKNIKMGFSMNFFPYPAFPDATLLVAQDQEGKVLMGCSFYPYNNQQGMFLDLTLRSPDCPNGIGDACIVEAINHFKQQNIKELSLGFAAKLNTEGETDPELIQKGLEIFYTYFNRFYNFQSILAFKNKFKPVWQPRYLVYTNHTQLVKASLALLQVHNLKKIKSKNSLIVTQN